MTFSLPLLALLLAGSVALGEGLGEEGARTPGWLRGLQAVVTVVFVVVVAVVARHLGSRASTWSANRRRAARGDQEPPRPR